MASTDLTDAASVASRNYRSWIQPFRQPAILMNALRVGQLSLCLSRSRCTTLVLIGVDEDKGTAPAFGFERLRLGCAEVRRQYILKSTYWLFVQSGPRAFLRALQSVLRLCELSLVSRLLLAVDERAFSRMSEPQIAEMLLIAVDVVRLHSLVRSVCRSSRESMEKPL